MRIHTSEPWHECAEGECGCGQILGQGSVYITTVKDPAIRRRIVACVNACRGLPTDELEQKGLVAAVGTQLLDVDQRCDELLEELVITLGSLKEICHLRQIPLPESAIRCAEAAIAKAKGGAA